MPRYYIEEDENNPGQVFKRLIDGSYVNYNAAPIGAVEQCAGATIPPGWLQCNGQAVSRTYYNFLFNTIGTTYGAGDGTTTFNVPTMSNLVPNVKFMIKAESTLNGNYLGIKGGGETYADNPLGTILSYGGTTAPEGWELCHGQLLSRIEYADLFAVIGTNFGAGDGSTTFKLPDLRGEFLRGAGTNSHTYTGPAGETVSEGSGGTVGEHQTATKEVTMRVDLDYGGLITGSYSGAEYRTSNQDSACTGVGRATVAATYGTVGQNTWYTARPTNTSVEFIIKVKKTDVPIDMMSAMNSLADARIASLNLGAFYFSNIVTAANPSWGNVTYTFSTPVPPGKYIADIRCENRTNTEGVYVIANVGNKLGEAVLSRNNWSGQGVMHLDSAPINITTPTSSISGQVAILNAVTVAFQLHLTKIA